MLRVYHISFIPETEVYFRGWGDKDNRKVSIKRNAGKWRNGQNSFPPRKVDSCLTKRGHHKHRNPPPKNPKRKRYI